MILHDQAADLGGQERVLHAMLERYPAAPALAPRFATTNRPAGHGAPWDGRSRLVGRFGRRRSFLAPLYAHRIRSTNLDDADIALSITQGGWTLAARLSAGAPHVCYSSGLPQHLYGAVGRYLSDQPGALRPAFAAALPALRAFDRRLMSRPDRLIANSSFSARELERIHARSAEVVHPPVRTEFFTPNGAERRHFLVVARLIAFKRVEVVVEAFRGLDEQLVVAGAGPRLDSLRRAAPPNVRFAGACDDDALLHLYRSSRALICPSRETFGLVMAEAHACGIPVIAPAAGGALEVVSRRETGILVERTDPRLIAEAVSELGSAPLSSRACRESAERFTEARFTEAMARILEEELAARPRLAPAPPR